MKKTISIYEQVGIGNMWGDDDNKQQQCAKKYVELMESELENYCNENYPEYDVKIDLSIENVSGCTAPFQVNIDPMSDDDDEIETDIETHGIYYSEKIGNDGSLFN